MANYAETWTRLRRKPELPVSSAITLASTLRKLQKKDEPRDISEMVVAWRSAITKAFNPDEPRDARGRWYQDAGGSEGVPYGHEHGTGAYGPKFQAVSEGPHSKNINNLNEALSAALGARNTFRRSGIPENDPEHRDVNSHIASLQNELRTEHESRKTLMGTQAQAQIKEAAPKDLKTSEWKDLSLDERNTRVRQIVGQLQNIARNDPAHNRRQWATDELGKYTELANRTNVHGQPDVSAYWNKIVQEHNQQKLFPNAQIGPSAVGRGADQFSQAQSRQSYQQGQYRQQPYQAQSIPQQSGSKEEEAYVGRERHRFRQEQSRAEFESEMAQRTGSEYGGKQRSLLGRASNFAGSAMQAAYHAQRVAQSLAGAASAASNKDFITLGRHLTDLRTSLRGARSELSHTTHEGKQLIRQSVKAAKTAIGVAERVYRARYPKTESHHTRRHRTEYGE